MKIRIKIKDDVSLYPVLLTRSIYEQLSKIKNKKLREEAIYNLNKHIKKDITWYTSNRRKEVYDITEALYVAFPWQDYDETPNYWLEVHDKSMVEEI